MADFGWAYINCSSTGSGGAYGPTGSVQFLWTNLNTTGSQYLMFHTASVYGYQANTLVLTGALLVSGAITASDLRVETITNIDATGSTYFGDTNDDIHMRTGSMYVVGTTSGSGSFYVSGSTILAGALSSSAASQLSGNVMVGGTLNVSGATTLASTLSSSNTAIIVGNTILGNALNVSGATTLAGTTTLGAALSSSAGAQIVGNSIFGGTLNVSGASVFSSSVTAGTSFIIGSADLNETDMEKLDGITDGTVTANKAVVVDGSKNIGTLGTVACAAITTSGLFSSSAGAALVGSVSSSGDLAVTGAVHATAFYGNGSGLTGVVDASSGADNRVAVFTDSDTIQGNPDFEFDSSAAMVTIGGTVTTGISASGPATFVGSTTLVGTLNVSGAATLAGTTTLGGALSSSAGAALVGSLSSSGDLAVSGAAHAAAFYGDGSGLTGIGSSVSGSDRVYSSTGVETSGYLKASGSVVLGDNVSDIHKISGSLSVYRDNNTLVMGVDPNTYTTTIMGLNSSYEPITTNAQTSSEASFVIGINTGDSDVDFRVLSASTAGSGSLLVIKDEVTSRSGTKIYVSASGDDTIDGQTHYIITGSMASINLYSNGTDKWFIF